MAAGTPASTEAPAPSRTETRVSKLAHVSLLERRSPACEHVFVTAQGRPLTRYRRALERRHIFGAEIALREMSYVSLRDALGLLALYAAEDSPKYEKAAVRWLARLALEHDDLTLPDFQLASSALAAMPRRPDEALHVLRALSR